MKISQFKILILLAIVFFIKAASANVVGVDVQNFNPITSGLDFVTVQSSETLRPCQFNCGVFVNYVKNSLPNFKPAMGAAATPDNSVVSSDLNFGLGLTKNWDFGLSIANVHSSEVDASTATIQYDSKGLNDIRLNTKYRLKGNEKGGFAGVLSANFTRIENSPYSGADPDPSINLEMVADTTLSNSVAVAFNLGYRFKGTGTPIVVAGIGAIEPLGDQWIASAAASYYFENSATKLIGEIYGSVPANSDAKSSFVEGLETLELLLGVKHDFSSAAAGHFGGTMGLMDGTASPDWRVYAGFNWAFGPLGFCRKPKLVRVEKDQTPAEALDDADDMSILEEAPSVGQNPFTHAPKADRERFVVNNVLFDVNSDVLSPEGEEAVARLAEYLNQPSSFASLLIEGHTDSMSDKSYNLKLSQRRAKQVRKELLKHGVNGPITTKGHGEAKPIADNSNPQGRSLNRRVEFIVKWK